MTPGLFPPVTTDGNMVRVLSCSGGRTEWVYRANDGQWILPHYAATGDEPCDVAQPLAKGEHCHTAHRAGKGSHSPRPARLHWRNVRNTTPAAPAGRRLRGDPPPVHSAPPHRRAR